MANEKLKSLERRIKKLEEHILRQKVGPETQTSKRILAGLKRRYDELVKNNSIFVPEASTDDPFPRATSFGDNEWNNYPRTFTEEELIEKLGAIYWIFGPAYEEIFSYKKYRIEFLELLHPDCSWNPNLIMTVKVKIYENDKPFVTKESEIRFWKGFLDSREVDELEFSTMGTTKYNNYFWFEKISYNLVRTWNNYFRHVPLTTATGSSLMQHTITSELQSNGTTNSYKKWGYVPQEALRIIRHYDKLFAQEARTGVPISCSTLITWSNVYSSNMEYTLEYALDQGTPYIIVNEKIYVWYKSHRGFSRAGYYRLKHFEFNEHNVIFIMDSCDKLPKSFNF